MHLKRNRWRGSMVSMKKRCRLTILHHENKLLDNLDFPWNRSKEGTEIIAWKSKPIASPCKHTKQQLRRINICEKSPKKTYVTSILLSPPNWILWDKESERYHRKAHMTKRTLIESERGHCSYWRGEITDRQRWWVHHTRQWLRLEL